MVTERGFFTTQHFPDKNDTRLDLVPNVSRFALCVPRFLISSRHYSDVTSLDSFFNVDVCKVEPERIARLDASEIHAVLS